MREITHIPVEAVAKHYKESVATVRKWAKKEGKPYQKKIEKSPEDYKVVKAKEISEMLGIPRATIKKWAEKRMIPAVKFWGHPFFFMPGDVLEWANNGYEIKMFDQHEEIVVSRDQSRY